MAADSTNSRVYTLPGGAIIKDMDISADGETIVVAGCGGEVSSYAFVRMVDLGKGELGAGTHTEYKDATSVTRLADGAFAVGVYGDSMLVVGPGPRLRYKEWMEAEKIVRTEKLVANRAGTKLARVTLDSSIVDILTLDAESNVIDRLSLEQIYLVTAVAWSPADDNILVVAAYGKVTLYDLNLQDTTTAGRGDHGGYTRDTWPGGNGPISSIAYDPSSNGNTIAVGYMNGYVCRWDLSSPHSRPIDTKPLMAHSSLVRPGVGVQYSPCGTILATYAFAGIGAGVIKLWDTTAIKSEMVEYGDVHSHILRGHTRGITKVVFDPISPSTTLYSCSYDGTVREWDIPDVRPRGGALTKAAGRRPLATVGS